MRESEKAREIVCNKIERELGVGYLVRMYART